MQDLELLLLARNPLIVISVYINRFRSQLERKVYANIPTNLIYIKKNEYWFSVKKNVNYTLIQYTVGTFISA